VEAQSYSGSFPARYPFVGEMRATDLASGTHIYGATEDLSKGGCWLLLASCMGLFRAIKLVPQTLR
jgi:hypothetical protein